MATTFKNWSKSEIGAMIEILHAERQPFNRNSWGHCSVDVKDSFIASLTLLQGTGHTQTPSDPLSILGQLLNSIPPFPTSLQIDVN